MEQLVNDIQQADRPDPKAANALQEGLGGQFGEMRTMMQYLFQNFFRGKAKPFRDLLRSIATEEIAHVELISTTINILLEGATSTTDSVETVIPLTFLNDPVGLEILPNTEAPVIAVPDFLS